MTALRALFRAHRHLALLLVVVALAVRLLVPAGTMPGSGARVLSVEICADASGLPQSHKLVIPGQPAPHEDNSAKGTCAFAGLAAAGRGRSGAAGDCPGLYPGHRPGTGRPGPAGPFRPVPAAYQRPACFRLIDLHPNYRSTEST